MSLTVLSEAPLGMGVSFGLEILVCFFFHLLSRRRAVNAGSSLGLDQNPV